MEEITELAVRLFLGFVSWKFLIAGFGLLINRKSRIDIALGISEIGCSLIAMMFAII